MRTSSVGWVVPVVALLLACGGPGRVGDDGVQPAVEHPVVEPDGGTLPPPPPPPPPPARYELPPLQTGLQDYALEMPEATLQNFLKDRNAPEADATFVVDGVRYPAKVRLRGASARTFPKVSWNVDLVDQKFEGRGSLNLIAEFQDRTFMTEKLAYDVLAALGVPAPRAKFVRLAVNGRFQGVYVDLEQVNGSFAKNHELADPAPTVFRCGWKDCEFKEQKLAYQGDWVQKTNESAPQRALLDEMLRRINRTPDPELPAALEQSLELDAYLRTLVADVLMSNNFVQDSESYFLYDRVTRRWSYVPWDLNNVDPRWWPSYGLGATPNYFHTPFSYTLFDTWTETRNKNHDGLYWQRIHEHPGYLPAWSNLATRVVAHPELRARLLAHYDKARADFFTPEVLHARIDAMYALIAPDVERDPYINLQDKQSGVDANGIPVYPADPDGLAKFRAGRQYVKDFVTKRIQFLEEKISKNGYQPALARFRTSRPADATRAGKLALRAFDPNANWVELENLSDKDVSLANLVLTTDLRRTLRPVDGSTTCTPKPPCYTAPRCSDGVTTCTLPVACADGSACSAEGLCADGVSTCTPPTVCADGSTCSDAGLCGDGVTTCSPPTTCADGLACTEKQICPEAPDTPACVYFPSEARRLATVLSGSLGAKEVKRFDLGTLGLSLKDRTELGVFDGTSVVGFYDFAFFGALPSGQRYERTASGATWEVR